MALLHFLVRPLCQGVLKTLFHSVSYNWSLVSYLFSCQGLLGVVVLPQVGEL